MSSRRRSIIKPFPEARYSSAFSVRIFVKDYYFPSNIRLNWHTPLFSRHGIIKASLTSLTFLTIGKLQASLIFRSLNRKVRFCSWLNENNPMIRWITAHPGIPRWVWPPVPKTTYSFSCTPASRGQPSGAGSGRSMTSGGWPPCAARQTGNIWAPNLFWYKTEFQNRS